MFRKRGLNFFLHFDTHVYIQYISLYDTVMCVSDLNIMAEANLGCFRRLCQEILEGCVNNGGRLVDLFLFNLVIPTFNILHICYQPCFR